MYFIDAYHVSYEGLCIDFFLLLKVLVLLGSPCFFGQHTHMISSIFQSSGSSSSGSNISVYVLELQRGFFYVGKSNDVQRRIQQHVHGKDASYWCRKYGPVVSVHAPITPFKVDMDTWERDETMARMLKHGFHCVRGWQILDGTESLSPASYHTIRNLIIGSMDLCRACGNFGHFATECTTPNAFKASWLQKLDACIAGGGAPSSSPSSSSSSSSFLSPSLKYPLYPRDNRSFQRSVSMASCTNQSCTNQSCTNPIVARDDSGKRFANYPSSFKHSECFRCGRYGHWVKDCFAKTHRDGTPLRE